MRTQNLLGDASDDSDGIEGLGGGLGDYDDANLFGLDEMGRPVGIHSWWGVLAAGAVGTGTAVAVQSMAKTQANVGRAEAYGLGAAVLVSGGLLISAKTRHAGVCGLITALANHAPRLIRDMAMKGQDSVQAAQAAANVARAGGAVTPPPVSGVEIVERPAFHGGGQLGLIVPEATHALGAPPHRELPQLVGSPFQQAAAQVQLLGGPDLAALAGHWGSTHFNKGF